MHFAKIKNKKNTLMLFGMAALAVLCCWNIGQYSGAVVYPDEVGFWAAAAWYTGEDWSGVMRMSPYYGYGYGLILAPLFFVFKSNPTLLYQAAIILNVVLLLLTFLLACKTAGNLFPTIPDKTRVLVCFIINCYTSNIFNTQCTYTETLIVFLLWIVVFILSEINKASFAKTKGYVLIALLALVNAWLVAVHMRCLIIAIASVVTMFVMWWSKKLNHKQAIFFFGIMVICLAGTFFLKNWMTGGLYSGGAMSSKNNVGDMVSRMSNFVSLDVIMTFCEGIIGRIMYSGSATFTLFYWGAIALTMTVVKGVKKRQPNRKEIRDDLSSSWQTALFLLLSMAGAIALSSYSMTSWGRLDHIMYGRYHEHLFGPFLLFGILYLYVKGRRFLTQILITAFHMFLAWLTYKVVASMGLTSPSEFVVSGIYSIPAFSGMTQEIRFTIWSALVAVILGAILWFGFHQRMIAIKKCLLLAMGIVWIYLAISAAGTGIYSRKAELDQVSEFAQTVTELTGGQTIYYLRDQDGTSRTDDLATWGAFRLKYFLPTVDLQEEDIGDADNYEFFVVRDSTISQLETQLHVKVYECGGYSLYAKAENASTLVATQGQEAIHVERHARWTVRGTVIEKQKGMQWVESGIVGVDDISDLEKAMSKENDTYALLINAGNELAVQHLQQQIAADQTTEEELDAQIAAIGVPQYTAFGPYITLDPGTYQVSFTLQGVNLENAPDDLGRCEVSTNTKTVTSFPLTKEMLADGGLKLIQMEFITGMSGFSQVEFRIFTNQNVQLRLTDISYQRTSLTMQAVSNNSDDMETLKKLVALDSSSLPVRIVASTVAQQLLSVSELENVLVPQGHAVNVAPLDDLSKGGKAILLVPATATNQIYELLPEYTLLQRLNDYAVLVPASSELCTAFREHGGYALSRGEAISLRYFTETAEYTPESMGAAVPAGEYQLDYAITSSGAALFPQAGTFYLSYNETNLVTPLTQDLFADGIYQATQAITMPADGKITIKALMRSEVSSTSLDAFLSYLGPYVAPVEPEAAN